MSDSLNEKIKEIGSMFGIDEIPDNIGDIVQSFIGSDNSEITESKEINKDNLIEQNNENTSGFDFDINKCVQIMNKYKEVKNHKNKDKKIQLLYAIEPFLNDKRKDKVSNCVKLLTFADVAKDLKLF